MVYPFASAEAEHIALKLNTQSGCASWELLLYVFPQSLFRLTVTVAHVFLSSRIRANGANAGRFPGCVRSGCASPSTRSLFGGGSLVEFDELALGAQLVPGVRLYAVLTDLAGADMDEASLVVTMT